MTESFSNRDAPSRGLPHEADAVTEGSEVVLSVRDEAERRGIRISHETLMKIGEHHELYRRAMSGGSVFTENYLMPPPVLRVREKFRNEFPQFDPVPVR